MVDNTTVTIKEFYELMSNSNHWLISEEMRVRYIEENGAMHIFYEKKRKFVDAAGRCLSIDVKCKHGHSYVSPHDQISSKVYKEDVASYGEDKCDIYAFINYYLPSHPEATDVVEELICKIGNNEFTVTPDYAYLMYLDVLNRSKLQETPIELGNPDASLNISY